MKSLNTIQEVIDYVKDCDVLIVRNIEGDEEQHWVENYDTGDPEIIHITYELFMDLYDHESFGMATDISCKDEEFYLRYYGESSSEE